MASMALTSLTFAADKSFSASGTVTKLTAEEMTVRTSTQDLELKRNASTKTTGGPLKKSSMVKVIYTKANGVPTATSIEVKKTDR